MTSTPTGENHYNWKGDAVGTNAGRERARKRYGITACESCGEPGYDRHHLDGNTANNEPENIQILCRRCHMTEDGRLATFLDAAQRARDRKALKPTCKYGHSLTDPKNVYHYQGHRGCRRCRADAEARRRARKRDIPDLEIDDDVN